MQPSSTGWLFFHLLFMTLDISLIIPVYNRPEEVRELFQSLVEQSFEAPYEIVLVEDGSTDTAETVVRDFEDQLSITYLTKANSGPGDSRNYGMRKAAGNYFIILDSDCILPPDYLQNVQDALEQEYVDCFGGPDSAHASFNSLQQAINYSMTSFWTTGGIRGHKKAADKFQPRSFNMGLSREAFEKTGGFGNIHPGEDPDLSLRLKALGFKTKLFPEAVVFHKRRINWRSFFKQVRKFGMCRPILNKWHRGSARLTYWFPTLFILGLIFSLLLLLIPWYLPIGLYGLYFLIVFLDALRKTGSVQTAFTAMIAVFVQFLGYGYGFLKSTILVNFSKKSPEQLFPELFF